MHQTTKQIDSAVMLPLARPIARTPSMQNVVQDGERCSRCRTKQKRNLNMCWMSVANCKPPATLCPRPTPVPVHIPLPHRPQANMGPPSSDHEPNCKVRWRRTQRGKLCEKRVRLEGSMHQYRNHTAERRLVGSCAVDTCRVLIRIRPPGISTSLPMQECDNTSGVSDSGVAMYRGSRICLTRLSPPKMGLKNLAPEDTHFSTMPTLTSRRRRRTRTHTHTPRRARRRCTAAHCFRRSLQARRRRWRCQSRRPKQRDHSPPTAASPATTGA